MSEKRGAQCWSRMLNWPFGACSSSEIWLHPHANRGAGTGVPDPGRPSRPHVLLLMLLLKTCTLRAKYSCLHGNNWGLSDSSTPYLRMTSRVQHKSGGKRAKDLFTIQMHYCFLTLLKHFKYDELSQFLWALNIASKTLREENLYVPRYQN